MSPLDAESKVNKKPETKGESLDVGLTGLTVLCESNPVRQIQRQWAGWMDGSQESPL